MLLLLLLLCYHCYCDLLCCSGVIVCVVQFQVIVAFEKNFLNGLKDGRKDERERDEWMHGWNRDGRMFERKIDERMDK